MPTRSRRNKLERWEIALIKAMLEKGTFGNDQDILAYFTRPSRSINHARILEIRREEKHARIRPATDDNLDTFIESWPHIEPETGLHILNDELLIKAREAMLFAVQNYNNPRTYFRSEIFIVTAIIAWTYLLHAYYKMQNVDYRYTAKAAARGVRLGPGATKGSEPRTARRDIYKTKQGERSSASTNRASRSGAHGGRPGSGDAGDAPCCPGVNRRGAHGSLSIMRPTAAMLRQLGEQPPTIAASARPRRDLLACATR